MSRTWGIVLVVAAIGTNAARADEAWERAIAQRLKQRVSVSFKNASVLEVTAELREVCGFNLVLDDEARRYGAEQRITLELTDIELRNVFALIEQQCSLHHALRDGVMLLSRDERPEPVVVRAHDVADLLAPLRDFIGPQLGLPRVSQSYGGCCIFVCDEPPRGVVRRDELVRMVRAQLGSEWDKHADAEIAWVRGQLVVTHTEAVQRRVAQLLRTLRRNR